MKPKTIKALRKALSIVAYRSTEDSYGHFYGGDPRDFHPDPECSTEAERSAHQLACEAAERDEKARALPGAHQPVTPAEARQLVAEGKADSALIGPHGAHVHMTGFGLGTTTFRDEEMEEVARAINAALSEVA